MERIGIAASKMAQGNLWLYNFFVVVISILFSILIFLVSGVSIIIALVLIAYISSGFVKVNLDSEWFGVLKLCLTVLAVLIGLFNLGALLKNIKFRAGK